MSQSKMLPHSKEASFKSYNKRMKDDIKSMVDNFTEIIKLATSEDGGLHSLNTAQDQNEIQVRAANMVRASESLMKLISDIKEQYVILNDFPSVNEAISRQTDACRALEKNVDSKLVALRDDMAAVLHELEEEYYSSEYK